MITKLRSPDRGLSSSHSSSMQSMSPTNRLGSKTSRHSRSASKSLQLLLADNRRNENPASVEISSKEVSKQTTSFQYSGGQKQQDSEVQNVLSFSK